MMFTLWCPIDIGVTKFIFMGVQKLRITQRLATALPTHPVLESEEKIRRVALHRSMSILYSII